MDSRWELSVNALRGLLLFWCTDGQLGFDDDALVTEKEDPSGKLDESALGASSVADSGISESGPDTTPHGCHAKDELTDFLLHESFDDSESRSTNAFYLEEFERKSPRSWAVIRDRCLAKKIVIYEILSIDDSR